MNRSNALRAVGLLALVAALLGFLTLAPSSLGGTATWVSTSGISMQPNIHTGDLVIARPRASYEVGDVVAYPSKTLEGTVVLHRIVASRADGFVTQGDNNDWLDPDRPHSNEILGAMWLHIPGGGRVLAVFTNPFVIVSIGVLLLTLGGVSTARRTRRRSQAAQASRPRTAGTGSWRTYVTPQSAGVTGLAAVAIAALAFSQPAQVTTSSPVPFTHTATVSYSASAHKDGVYPDGEVRTGDPVFLSVAPVLDTRVVYQLDADSADLAGTIGSTAHLSASNGWERTVTLAQPKRFSGSVAEQTAEVDLPALLAIVHRAERAVGTTFGSYGLEISYPIALKGTVAGKPVHTAYTPKMSFTLDDVQALPSGDQPDAAGGLRLNEPGKVVRAGLTANTVPVLRWTIPVLVLRVLAIALGIVALGMILLVRGREGELSAAAEFGDRLIRATNADPGARTVIDLDDPKALLKVARMYDTVVIGVSDELFFVNTEDSCFRYAATPSDAPSRHRKSAAHS